MRYYISSGDQRVHKENQCLWLYDEGTRDMLGDFDDIDSAESHAKAEGYPSAMKCLTCAYATRG